MQFVRAYQHYDSNCCYNTGQRIPASKIQDEMIHAQATVFDATAGEGVNAPDRVRLEMLEKTFRQVFGSLNIPEDNKINGGDMTDRAFFDHIRRDIAPILAEYVQSITPAGRVPGKPEQ